MQIKRFKSNSFDFEYSCFCVGQKNSDTVYLAGMGICFIDHILIQKVITIRGQLNRDNQAKHLNNK